jgi:hypothetical protein
MEGPNTPREPQKENLEIKNKEREREGTRMNGEYS